MDMHKTTLPFGALGDGREAHQYLLTNDNGMTVGVTDLGADLVSVRVPDGHGRRPDVLLGYDGVAGYEENGPLFGAIVGRVANRIGGASFELGGRTYRLAKNDGDNNNHSGPHMYFQRLWKTIEGKTDDTIAFELLSRDGDQGFPGALDVVVSYTLGEDNTLRVHYESQPSAPTLVNLTCHAYWNLDGHASGSVLGHALTLDSDEYAVATPALIPTGELAAAVGDMDFREPRTLASGIGSRYDTYYFLRDKTRHLRHAARLVGDASGIAMDVLTDAPGLQVYTGGFLDERLCKDGVNYPAGSGVALETQLPPDAIHHKQFPQPVFTPERPFSSTTVFAFGIVG